MRVEITYGVGEFQVAFYNVTGFVWRENYGTLGQAMDVIHDWLRD